MSRFIDFLKPKAKIESLTKTLDEIPTDPNLRICSICLKETKSYATGHNGEIICMECHNKIMENM